jgi:hypothetical protein
LGDDCDDQADLETEHPDNERNRTKPEVAVAATPKVLGKQPRKRE